MSWKFCTFGGVPSKSLVCCGDAAVLIARLVGVVDRCLYVVLTWEGMIGSISSSVVTVAGGGFLDPALVLGTLAILRVLVVLVLASLGENSECVVSA